MIAPLLLAVPWLAPAPAAPVPGPVAAPAGAVVRPIGSTLAGAPGQEGTERVQLVTSDRLTIHADYYSPRTREARAPSVLLVHDAGGNRKQLTDIAEGLRRKGFGVLAIDLRGHGESKTESIDWSKLNVKEHAELWQFMTRDLVVAADWLRDRKDLHATNLNLIGMGSGCTLVVKHAGRDENVRSLVLLDPPTEQLGYDMQGDILEIAGLPTYVVIPRARRAYAEAIVEIANTEAGIVFVEPRLLSSKVEGILDDRGLPADIARWVASKAMPKRGR